MKTQTVKDFQAEGVQLFGEDSKNWKFRCPRCGTVQSWQDFIDLGIDEDKAEAYTGFYCVGRYTKTKGCDWTLGGLLKAHKLEVVDLEGKHHPHFEFAKETA